jgi:hypothetical protein
MRRKFETRNKETAWSKLVDVIAANCRSDPASALFTGIGYQIENGMINKAASCFPLVFETSYSAMF